MRFLNFEEQQRAYKLIHETIKTLASVDSQDHRQEINYAIGDMWALTRMIGGERMIKALEVKRCSK